MVTFLGSRLEFPPAWTASREGLVAIGGDLSVERILLAYRSGIFPWPVLDGEPMTWFSPDPRAVLELDALHVSRSLRKVLRKGQFEVTVNHGFEGVLMGCGAPAPDRPSTWITPALAAAYVALHRAGHAHSVETWQAGHLVGGLYGVAVGGLFAGESMFSRVPDASKVALVALVERLRARGYALLDVQQPTDHLLSMGATTIPRREYLRRLAAALPLERRFA